MLYCEGQRQRTGNFVVVRREQNETEDCVIKYTLTAAVSEIPDSYATEKDSAPQESQRLLLLMFSTATRPP
jgi:type VI protein secretion system component Hcp